MDVEVITTFATRSGRLFHGAAGCARAMGMQIQIMNARTRREIDAAFETIARERHDALLVGSDTFFRGRGAASLHQKIRARSNAERALSPHCG